MEAPVTRWLEEKPRVWRLWRRNPGCGWEATEVRFFGESPSGPKAVVG